MNYSIAIDTVLYIIQIKNNDYELQDLYRYCIIND
jgi:hypothetical protein